MNTIQPAVSAAKAALEKWAATPIADRAGKIEKIAAGYRAHKANLGECISRQTGKPRWESALEVDAMVGKASISITAQTQRRTVTENIAYRPIGILGVLGPFNMPGHLPNGHLIPAVLAGNTVVFKPSELTPEVGELMSEIWTAADLPAGVFNLVQGGAEVGNALTTHPDIDGILFTGSYSVGSAIHRALAGHPEKLLALEMGGNNPLIVWDCDDLDAAAYSILQSAYITSGQRCTCARRLIIQPGTQLIERLTKMIARIRIGLYKDMPEPFLGPVISPAAAQKLLQTQSDLKGRAIVEMKLDSRSPALLNPGLMDMTGVPSPDVEVFGPLLQVIEVPNFDAAILEANRTRYGLAAGLLSDRPEFFEQFRARIRAGVLSFNRPTTGARSDLPFGGVGFSGNHRPSALFAADYCTDPVASVQTARVTMPDKLSPGIELP